MTTVAVEGRGSVAVLRLRNGVTNAIGPAMIDDLSQAVRAVPRDSGGMVLAGGEKFFSIGFDLPAILKFTKSEMTQFFRRFNDLTLDLYTLPLPTCCAMAGHATAGGCILASSCDFRLAIPGKKLIGLNEVRLGVPVPCLADLLLRQLTGDRAATDMLFRGEFITSAEANRIGLVDELCEPENLEPRAIEKVAAMAALPRDAFAAIKENRTQPLVRQYEADRAAKDAFFIDCWFSDPAQRLLQDAATKF